MKMAAEMSMMNSVRWLEDESHTVRLAAGMLDDGRMNGNIDAPTLPGEEALRAILCYLDRRGMDRLWAATQIIIAPGYQFKIVRGMVTNFHQPQSTLLLLVSAFVGGDWRTIYDYALAHDFRFLSYGDSSLLL